MKPKTLGVDRQTERGRQTDKQTRGRTNKPRGRGRKRGAEEEGKQIVERKRKEETAASEILKGLG